VTVSPHRRRLFEPWLLSGPVLTAKGQRFSELLILASRCALTWASFLAWLPFYLYAG
jgi:hypothetical protein